MKLSGSQSLLYACEKMRVIKADIILVLLWSSFNLVTPPPRPIKGSQGPQEFPDHILRTNCCVGKKKWRKGEIWHGSRTFKSSIYYILNIPVIVKPYPSKQLTWMPWNSQLIFLCSVRAPPSNQEPQSYSPKQTPRSEGVFLVSCDVTAWKGPEAPGLLTGKILKTGPIS